MYILYHKQSYIVKEPLTKNRTCQAWRRKQIAMCEDKEPLEEWIEKQNLDRPENFYIEKQPDR